MSLRARLVSALLVMFVAGMAVYGVASYRAFASAELARFDDQVRAALPIVERELHRLAGAEWSGGPGGGRPPGPHVVVASGTYGELRDADGTILASLSVVDGEVTPDLSGLADLEPGRLVTVGSLDGDGSWRVVTRQGPDLRLVVAAAPMASVEAALSRLLTIELVAGASLLVVLGLGAWLVLRTGLRPLERIAGTARSITAGSLDQRVPTPAAGTEVRELATALNAMLDDLEDAFLEREATEARLRRFLADASHELRTPLTSIQGYAELFRLTRVRDDAEVDLDLVMRRIEDEAGRMGDLVGSLLTLARLDEGAPVVRERVDLTALAADACADAAAIDPGRRIDLDAAGPVEIEGDPRHLRQAIGNLVMNALRHTPAGTPVDVRVADRDGAGVVEVRDHGPGIPDDQLARVFERFWQADPARAGAGSGLGLSIVAAVAAEHGGTAEARSTDDGAAFTLAIPAVADRRVGSRVDPRVGPPGRRPAAPSPGVDADGRPEETSDGH